MKSEKFYTSTNSKSRLTLWLFFENNSCVKSTVCGTLSDDMFDGSSLQYWHISWKELLQKKQTVPKTVNLRYKHQSISMLCSNRIRIEHGTSFRRCRVHSHEFSDKKTNRILEDYWTLEQYTQLGFRYHEFQFPLWSTRIIEIPSL